MTPTDLRQNFPRREEGRSSLIAVLKPPSFIYAASRAEEPQKLAKLALSSETWVRAAGAQVKKKTESTDVLYGRPVRSYHRRKSPSSPEKPTLPHWKSLESFGRALRATLWKPR